MKRKTLRIVGATPTSSDWSMSQWLANVILYIANSEHGWKITLHGIVVMYYCAYLCARLYKMVVYWLLPLLFKLSSYLVCQYLMWMWMLMSTLNMFCISFPLFSPWDQFKKLSKFLWGLLLRHKMNNGCGNFIFGEVECDLQEHYVEGGWQSWMVIVLGQVTH